MKLTETILILLYLKIILNLILKYLHKLILFSIIFMNIKINENSP